MRLALLPSVSLAALVVAGCTLGPDYRRPTVATPPAFKEAEAPSSSTWRQAQPSDAIDRGAWWSMFADAELDGLMRRVEVSNQNLAAATAAYEQARALVDQSRSNLFPSISGNAGATRSSSGRSGAVVPGAGGGFITSGSGAQNRFSVNFTSTWDADLWGRLRRTLEANRASVQASAADLANARLSAQAQLATAYFAMRSADEQKVLLGDTVAAYQRAVDLATNRYNAGVIARADVISAETQLRNAQAQLVDLEVGRSQNEHAIALLVGVPPSELTVAPARLARAVPTAPVLVPATLLERRPDIARDERNVAAANAQIGVATAAFFPNLTLSGNFGSNSSEIGDLFSAGTRTWSFGPQLASTLLDFGARKGRVKQARALHEQRTAQYRQTVLSAFREVEDQLSALRVYADEMTLREQTAAAARQAEALALNRYQAGQVDFNAVITAQTQALAADQNLIALVRQRLQASVALVQALGGGWTSADLPKG
jgi:NodT family efflux transporter outer membrane factor (OMF) lipoprotein